MPTRNALWQTFRESLDLLDGKRPSFKPWPERCHRGVIIDILRREMKPREWIWPPDDIVCGKDFIEWSTLRAWVRQWLQYRFPCYRFGCEQPRAGRGLIQPGKTFSFGEQPSVRTIWYKKGNLIRQRCWRTSNWISCWCNQSCDPRSCTWWGIAGASRFGKCSINRSWRHYRCDWFSNRC